MMFPFDLANYVREFRMQYTRELNEHFKDVQLGAMCIFGRLNPDRVVIQFSVGGEEVTVEIPPVHPVGEMVITAVIAMRKRLGLDEDEDD